MTLVELFLIAVGLSMDAFAVAVCRGLSMPKLRKDHAGIIALDRLVPRLPLCGLHP